MLQDHELFVQLCEKRGIAPPAEISDAIRIGSTTGELRLSCLSIMVPICEIIAQMLASSSTIRTVDLSDCMLLSKGLNGILNALCEGSSVAALYLKGNNISGAVVSRLGQVFERNNTLKRLHVEWNSIGTDAEAFAAFCDGLSRNHTIEELDMRYNQISPRCAESLCKVIRRNKSLSSLDLSWNTLGLQGGDAILDAVRENRSIVALSLRGNCVPESILRDIERHTRENRCGRVATYVGSSKTVEIAKVIAFEERENSTAKIYRATDDVEQSSESLLSSRKDGGSGLDGDSYEATPEKPALPRNHRKKKRKMKTRISPVDRLEDLENLKDLKDQKGRRSIGDRDDDLEIDSDSAETLARDVDTKVADTVVSINRRNVRTSEVDRKISELNEMLKERTAAIDLLTGEMTAKVAEVEAARSRVDELETEIGRLREDRDKVEQDRANEIAELQRSHKEAEEKWRKSYKELEANYQKCLQLKKESDAKARRYERDIHKSSLEIGMLKEKLVSITQAYEDLLAKDKTEMHRLRREAKERESRSRIEQSLLKSTLKETTDALEECQAQLQRSRAELRELSESQAALKARLSETEHVVLRHARLEEGFQRLKEEKDALEEKLTDSQRATSALQRQVTSLQGELVEPRRRHELLKEELEQERQKSERLRQELQEERARLKEQNLQIEKMAQQIAGLNAQLNDAQTSHAEALRERDRERRQLKEVIVQRERELSELRADEVQRAGQLYAAFSKYLGSIGPSPAL